jgi:hypothetical protein
MYSGSRRPFSIASKERANPKNANIATTAKSSPDSLVRDTLRYIISSGFSGRENDTDVSFADNSARPIPGYFTQIGRGSGRCERRSGDPKPVTMPIRPGTVSSRSSSWPMLWPARRARRPSPLHACAQTHRGARGTGRIPFAKPDHAHVMISAISN